MKKKQQLVEKSAGETSYSSVLPEPEVMSYKNERLLSHKARTGYTTQNEPGIPDL